MEYDCVVKLNQYVKNRLPGSNGEGGFEALRGSRPSAEAKSHSIDGVPIV